MAKAAFHKNQKVFVKPVGTWALVERVLPQWVKGLDEPLKVFYDVGLGREFGASELTPDKSAAPMDDVADLDNWRIYRSKNRWKDIDEVPNHPQPGTFPVVATDEKNWGGWRVPSAEYDRDPLKIEFQARIIEASPHLMRVAKALAQFGINNSDDMPTELLDLAKKASVLMRRIYDTPSDQHGLRAAE
ncbi:MAG: hypothetical protein SGJ21_05150 [Alphaproteobacteria bacterium]|nr:hypothetical protein [Alphaproteobacteria bacterium]